MSAISILAVGFLRVEWGARGADRQLRLRLLDRLTVVQIQAGPGNGVTQAYQYEAAGDRAVASGYGSRAERRHNHRDESPCEHHIDGAHLDV
jgi:hypothetical protein